MMTAFVAALVEGWQELMHHKVRVLLSLVGVTVSIASLTGVLAAGTMADQGLNEMYERMAGREGTYSLTVSLASDSSAAAERASEDVEEVLESFGVSHWSRAESQSVHLENDDSPSGFVSGTAVDPAYSTIFNVSATHGRWFADGDEENLAPPIVVDGSMAELYDVDTDHLPTTISVEAGSAGRDVTVVVIGVAPMAYEDPSMPQFYVLPENAGMLQEADPTGEFSRFGGGSVDLQVWLPVEIGDELAAQISDRIIATVPGSTAEMFRSDAFAWGEIDVIRYLQWALAGVSTIILVLAALSLLNINVVTVQQRIREMGIRRSFGATSGRLFFSVVMESVVATAVAGIVGVMIAIAVLKSPWVTGLLERVLSVVPAFPLSSAIAGVLVAVITGALAGVIPAIIAMRVSIIDAIRN